MRRRLMRERRIHGIWPIATLAVAAVLALLTAIAIVPHVSDAATRWLRQQPVRARVVSVDGLRPAATALAGAAASARAGGTASAGPSLERLHRTPSGPGSSAVSLDPGFEFNLIGAVGHWTGTGRKRARLLVRTSLDGESWSRWLTVTLDPAQGDQPGAKLMSDPVWVERGRYVEFLRSGPVKNLRLAFVNSLGTATTADRLVSGLKSAVATIAGLVPAGVARAQTQQPVIVSRAEWGADESWRRAAPSYADVKMAFVHHTAGVNTYTQEEAPGVVRAVYYLHAIVDGYNDIGYNFLIDRFGTVYEGRFGGIDRGVVGAQTLGFNTGSTGISVMGDFTKEAPPPAAIASLEQLLAWKLDTHHIDPTSPVTMTCGTTEKFFAGQAVTLPAISGHRDANYTACPGDKLYALLPEVRSVVDATGTPKIYSPTVTPATISPNGDGLADTAAIAASASETVAWQIVVANQAGTAVRSFSSTGATVSATWDGRDGQGKLAPTGVYSVTLSAVSPAGARARPAVATVSIGGTPQKFHGVLRTEALRAFTVRRGAAAKFRYRVVYRPGIGDAVYKSARVVIRIRDSRNRPRGTMQFPRMPLNKVRSCAIAHCRLARGTYSYAVYATLPDGTGQQRVGRARFVVK